MSINQSNLSAPQYGYDCVVATTMQAINANLLKFLAEVNLPPITQYYWNDANNNISLVSLETLEFTPVPSGSQNPSGTGGIDPAMVLAWNGQDPQPPNFSALDNSSFECGFIAKIGIPPGFCLPGAANPQNLPVLPLMATIDQAGSSVIFNLYCSSFQVFEANWGRGGISNYSNQSQPSGAAWALQATIPISQVLSNSNLPRAMQAQLNLLGPAAFTVRQLCFDLDNPSNVTASSVNFGGIQPGSELQTILEAVFSGLYCAGLAGLPAIGYSILPNTAVPDPSLGPGSIEMETNPFIPAGQDEGLSTLNYLCAYGSTVPAARPFSWNWIDDPSIGNQYDGVIAINKNSLTQYLAARLAALVAANCLKANVSVTGSGYIFSIVAGNPPAAVFPSTGPIVLSFNYDHDSYAQCGTPSSFDYSLLDIHPHYYLTVLFSGNTITVVQNLIVFANICNQDTCESGDYVDKTITDVYTITSSESGGLILSEPATTMIDNAASNGTGPPELITTINNIIVEVTALATFGSSNLGSMPIALIDNYVFPGGNKFVYSDIGFSDNLDLVAYIN